MEPSLEFYLAAAEMLDRALRTAELLTNSDYSDKKHATIFLSIKHTQSQSHTHTHSLVTYCNLSMKNTTIKLQSFGKS